jgi:hypothetical protein
MKLSEVKGERVFDVVADLIEPVATIAADAEVKSLFDRSDVPEDMTPFEGFMHKVRLHLPHLVREYRDELATIMATIEGITVEEYMDGLTMPKFIKDFVDLSTDGEFLAFFS